MVTDDQWAWLAQGRLPALDRAATGCGKTRQQIVRRALAFYLSRGEGRDVLDVIEGREQIARGEVHDLDDVIKEIEAIVRGDGD